MTTTETPPLPLPIHETENLLPQPEREPADLPSTEGTGPEAPALAAGTPDPPRTRWKSKSSRTRRGFTIHGYIGANGHGKTLAMVHDTKLSMDQGRRILSTVRLIDPKTGKTYENYEPLRELSQLIDARNCDVLLDEIVGALPSTSGQSLPLEVQLLLNQLRRRDVCLRWTAPSWMRCNVVLREVTQAVTYCRGYLMKYEHRGDESRMWGQNRLFRWTTYDAFEFTEWTDNKEKKLAGKANAWLWRPGSWAMNAYDTFDAVDNVDSGEGFCFRCGGQRPKKDRPTCTCLSH